MEEGRKAMGTECRRLLEALELSGNSREGKHGDSPLQTTQGSQPVKPFSDF
jgi:hypothetical protein